MSEAHPSLRVARVYLRVSTDAQDLERQENIIEAAKASGYYVAGVYREKASGARADRPELGGVSGNPRKFRHSALWNFLGGWSAA